MAVVGHAYIVVRALTDKVNGDIEKAFSGAGRSASNAGDSIGSNLSKGIAKGLGNIRITTFTDKINDSISRSQELAENFTSLVRKGFVAQGAFGAIVGSIGALVGGLGALIGAAGAAAGSLVALGAAAITAKVGMSIASFAMKGIGQAVGAATQASKGLGKSLKDIAFDAEAAALAVDRAAITLENARETVLRTQDLPSGSRVRREAELAYKEAELAYKRAQEAKKKGGDGTGGTAAQDPYAGLTPAQKTFAKYLAGLKPIMDDLREAAAKGFLPIIQTQLEKLIDARLPEILEDKFFKLGEGAGKAVENFTDIFLAGDNLRDFSTVLDDMAKNLPSFGTILGNVFGSFLSILEAADPLTRNFISFLEKKTSSFADFLDTKQASGELTTFFNRSGSIMGDFGKVFGNIFAGLGNIIKANFGPGSGGDAILQWLIGVTQGFRDVDAIGLDNYFAAAADNFIAMGDALGGAVNVIVASGSDPAVGDFWRNMDAAAFSFSKIVDGSIAAAPSLGDTLKLLADIVATLTDGLTAIAFFDVINTALAGVSETLRILRPLLDFAGPIFATISALMLVRGAILGFTSIMFGFIAKFVVATGSMFGFNAATALTTTGLLKVTSAAGVTGAAMTFALGPVGIAIAAIIAGVALLAVTLGGIKGNQMESATKGVTQGFRDGADAATIFGEATKAVSDGPAKDAIGDLSKLKDNLAALATVQKRSGINALGNFITRGLADSLESVGRSLGNLALDELPTAQKEFQKFTRGLGLNNDEIATALNEMDDYREALIDHADQMGINIRTQDGQIDMQKLANFSVGEGEIAQRRANDELQKSVDKLAAQSRSFVDYNGLLSGNKDATMKWAEGQAAATDDANDSWKDYFDGQTFNVDIFLEQLQEQVDAAGAWQSNIAKLTGKLPEAVLDQLIDMGESGAMLVASLTDGVNDDAELQKLIDAAAGLGDGLYKGAQDALDTKGPLQLQVTAGVSSAHLRELQNSFGPNFMVPTLPTAPRARRKDGGYIQGFYAGGPVSGAGTGRSDSIPAMLSNGEFVINSRATAQNRGLLEAINSNQEVRLAPSITINVNPSPGMDERALAAAVSRQIAFSMSKGGY